MFSPMHSLTNRMWVSLKVWVVWQSVSSPWSTGTTCSLHLRRLSKRTQWCGCSAELISTRSSRSSSTWCSVSSSPSSQTLTRPSRYYQLNLLWLVFLHGLVISTCSNTMDCNAYMDASLKRLANVSNSCYPLSSYYILSPLPKKNTNNIINTFSYYWIYSLKEEVLLVI